MYIEKLKASEAEALAYAEGYPGTARLFARIDDLQRALGQAIALLEDPDADHFDADRVAREIKDLLE